MKLERARKRSDRKRCVHIMNNRGYINNGQQASGIRQKYQQSYNHFCRLGRCPLWINIVNRCYAFGIKHSGIVQLTIAGFNIQHNSITHNTLMDLGFGVPVHHHHHHIIFHFIWIFNLSVNCKNCGECRKMSKNVAKCVTTASTTTIWPSQCTTYCNLKVMTRYKIQKAHFYSKS